MNISGLKRYFFLPSIYLLFFIFISVFSSIAQASSSDIQAQLSDNSGSTGFSVLNNSGNQVTRADSEGNLTTQGIMAAAGNVGAGTTTPRYALDVNGDIGNSNSGMLVLEGSVDTTYNVLDDSNGNAYFAGNVGIGSTVPSGTSLEVNGIIHSASGGFTFPDGTTQTSAASGGNSWSMSNGNVYTTTRTNNVGIGTSSPSALLAVGLNAFTVNTSGAITATTGITNSGAYIQNGGGAANTFTGNVGIGSAVPGTALDVNGTARMVGLTVSGGVPSSGYVLTAADSSGDTMWSPSGSVGTNYWSLTAGAGNVGISTTNTVGIGTTSAGAGAGLVVMNGNVGIGTWAPTASLAVGTNAFTVNSAGAITATTGITTSGAYTQSGSGTNSFNGNIGIGTTSVNSKLSVLGGASFGSYATTAAPAGGLIVSGNVGIASIAPGQALDVNGTARMVGLTVSGGVPSSGYVLTAADSSGDTMWSPSGSVGTNYWSLTAGAGNVGISTTNTVGIGTTAGVGAGLVVMNGNVGIGTWVPGQILAINGNQWINGRVYYSYGGTAAFPAQAITSESSNAVSYAPGFGSFATDNIDFATKGNVVLMSDANGNIGIGTVTPNGKLIVSGGNVGIGSLAPGTALDVNGTARMVGLTVSGGVPSSGYVLTAVDSSGDTMWSPSGSVGTNYWSLTAGAGNVGISTMNTVGIGTTSAGAGAGLVVMNGNVGIGTWVPGYNLTVAGGSIGGGSGGLTINAGGTNQNLNLDANGTGYVELSANGLVVSNIITSNTTLSIEAGASGSQPLVLGSNGTEQMRIAGTGNIGIGSTVPGQKLDVQGTVRMVGLTVSGGVPSSGYVLTAADSSGDTMWSPSGSVGTNYWSLTAGAGNVGISTTNTVGIGTTSAGAGAGLVVMNGNVGIGTWAPGYSLSINGNLGIGTNAPAGSLLVTSTGNVGIGSTVPTFGLDVGGAIAVLNHDIKLSGDGFNNTYMYFTPQSTHNAGGVWLNNDANQGWLVISNGSSNTLGSGVFSIIDPSNTKAPISINASDQVLIGGTNSSSMASQIISGTASFEVLGTSDLGGNVGIGTSTAAGGNLIVNGGGNVGIGSAWPGTALDVQGSVRATGFVAGTGGITLGGVTNTSWPAAGSNYWLNDAGNVGISTTYAVGIGTTFVGGAGEASFAVMNGNVGIGTWVPTASLAVGTNAFTVNSTGAITATTGITTSGAYTQSGTGVNYFTGNVGVGTTAPQTRFAVVGGNVGIGTWTAAGGNLIVNGGGNVGIGSAWPGTALDVQGSVRATGFVAGTGGITLGGVNNTSWPSAGSNYWSLTAAAGNVGISTTNTVGIGTTSAGAGAGLVVMNGNVGIGTWIPNDALDVEINNSTKGAAQFINNSANYGSVIAIGQSSTKSIDTGYYGSGETTFNSLVANTGYLASGTGASQLSIVTTGAQPITFDTDNFIERMRIQPTTGNVGIGSTVPGQTLDVQGTVRATEFIGSGAGLTNLPGGASAWSTGTGTVYTTTGSNNVGIGTTNPQGGLIVTNGNVGIGTWAPTASLAVGTNAFTVNSAGAITATTGITTSGAYTQSGTGVNYFTGNVGVGTTAPQTRFAVVGGNVGIGTWTAAGGNLIVNGGGNVGIGSAWPGTALDVQGSVRATGFVAGTGGITLGGVNNTSWPSAGSNYWSLTAAAGNVGISTTNTVGIGTTSAGAGAGLVVMNGNVGIGTWAPQASVDSTGTIRVTGNTTPGSGVGLEMQYLTGSGGYGQFLTYDRTNSVYHAFAFDALNEQFFNSGTEAMRITSGNLGIGTNTPSSRLTVLGNIGIGKTAGDSYLATAAPNGGMIVEGNVGIGSINPGQALDVQGTVRATNFIGNGSGLTGLPSSLWATQNTTDESLAGGNVGIGTTITSAGAALSVMNGNVGIGTWVPTVPLYVVGEIENSGPIVAGTNLQAGSNVYAATNGYLGWNNATAARIYGYSNDSSILENHGSVGMGTFFVGAIGIGTNQSSSYVTTQPPVGSMIVQGNVGIGSLSPGQALDVQGTVRATNFVGNGSGLTGLSSGLWNTTNTNDVYEKNGSTFGNVGIGTSITNAGAALTVMNGNVGIGTWVPGAQLDVNGNIQLETAGSTASSPTTIGFGPESSGNAQRIRIDTDDALQAVYGGRPAIYTYWGMEIHGQQEAALPAPTANGTSADPSLSVFGTASDAAPILQLLNNAGTSKFFTVTGSGNVGIGTWLPIQQLDIKGTGTSELTIQNNWLSSAGVWINMSTDGASAIGSGGAGVNPWVAYVPTAGDWFGGSAVGDIAYRNIGGRLLFGTTSTAPGMVIGTNNNVGIGSAAPGETLDVTGTVRATYFIGNGSGLTGITSGSNWIYTSSGNVGLSTTAAVGIGTTFVGGTGEASFSVMNGNVGIGTWVPTASLAVGTNAFTVNSSGAITATTGITTSGAYTQSGTGVNYFTGNVGVGTTAPQTRFAVVGGNVGIGTWTAAGGNLIVNGGGNVGIGSAWPGQALDVQGTVRATNFVGNGSGLTGLPSSGLWNTTNTNDVYEQNGSTFGNVGIGTTITNAGAALTVMNGNVGIGTWVPAFSLTVTSTNSTTAKFTNTTSQSSTQGAGLQVAQDDGTVMTAGNRLGFVAFGGSGNTTHTIEVGGGVFGFADGTWSTSSDPGYLTFDTTTSGSTSHTEKMRINNAGNVGIGTTTPVGGLVIMNGNVGIGTWVPSAPLQIGTDSSSTPGLLIGSSGATSVTDYLSVNSGRAMYGYDSGGPGGSGNLAVTAGATKGIEFYVNGTNGTYLSGTDAMYIASAGNVGIGSTVPGQVLDVQGTVRATNFVGNGSGLTGINSGLWATQNTTDQSLAGGNVGIGTTITNAGAALSVMNGNVGIGTWAPASLLDVAGNFILGQAASSADSISISGATDSFAGGNASHTGGAVSGSITSSGTGSLAFGYSQGSGGGNHTSIISNSDGSIALGYTTGGNIESEAAGSFAAGYASSGTLEATQSGAIAMGYTNGQNLEATGLGSIAMGYSLYTGSAIPVEATGTASVAIGQNVQATANNAFALGTSVVNNTASTFMVGFNTSPTLTVTSANVGIGSINPGQALDVQGTVRATNFVGNGSGLTGIGSGLWNTTNTNDVYEQNGSTFGNVGIGTTITNNAALTVMNGNVGIGTWVPSSTFNIKGSLAVQTTSTSASSYTALSTDQVILANAASNSVTITLPAVASVPGREYIIKKTDSSANSVTIQANASETIDGQNTVSTTTQYQSYTIVSNGTAWYII